MVKTVLSVSHQGLREWALQRISAILMIIYFVGLMIYFIAHPGLSFAEWHGLFSQTWVKVVTLLAILSLIYHAWIGVWTIITDYIHSFLVRALLNMLVILSLVTCLIWAWLILWSV